MEINIALLVRSTDNHHIILDSSHYWGICATGGSFYDPKLNYLTMGIFLNQPTYSDRTDNWSEGGSSHRIVINSEKPIDEIGS